MTLRATGTTVGTAVAVCTLIAMSIGAVQFFQSRADAQTAHDAISGAAEAAVQVAVGDRELGDLRMRLRLVGIEIRRYQDLSQVRPLTESERIDVRYLESERQLLQQRLLELSRTT